MYSMQCIVLLWCTSLSLFSTVPDNYLLFTQVHNSEVNFDVDTDIRMMSLDISGQYIDVLVPIELHGTETVFIAYDRVIHRVCLYHVTINNIHF